MANFFIDETTGYLNWGLIFVLIILAVIAVVLFTLWESGAFEQMTDLWGYKYVPDSTSGAHLGGWAFYQLQRGADCPVGSTNEGMCSSCPSGKKKNESMTAYSTADPTPYISEGQVVCPSGGIDQTLFVNPAY